MMRLYKSLELLLAVVLIFSACHESTQEEMSPLEQQLMASRITLPNGWSLTPPSMSVPLGDLPLNMRRSPSGKYLAVTNNGYGKHTVMLFQLVADQPPTLISKLEVPKAWYGLCFTSDDQTLFLSGGNDNLIRSFHVGEEGLVEKDSIKLGDPWPVKIGPAGMAIDDKSSRLFVVTKEDNSLYVCDLNSYEVANRISLPAEAYDCIVNSAKNELYISLWGGHAVTIMDTRTMTMKASVTVEGHPNAMAFAEKNNTLYVANANSNSVSVVDLTNKKVLEHISTSLHPDDPTGSTPNALALSQDNNTLFIANADNNDLVVFDVSNPGQSVSKGMIPTGWYPTAIVVDSTRILVANGKGEGSMANPKGPNPYIKTGDSTQYIGRLLTGSLSVFPMPTPSELAVYTKVAYQNFPGGSTMADSLSLATNPIPSRENSSSPIKYVFYVIKENRTYDQVFGDIPNGNGDSSLCLFPRYVSPNHHKLADEFVLFDNFYVDAEVSADGHNWSMAAYATDYTEKTWPTYYGDRGGQYEFEGGREIVYPERGYIWNYCKRAGVSYRSYGEFVYKGQATVDVLNGHIDHDFPGFDMDIMDTLRFFRWAHDFDSLLAIDAVPQFSTIRLSSDHTSGASLNKPTPRAYVADNDLGLGRLVDHITHSKIWDRSAIFVLEDDAQNGPDHVDAHRSVLLVISPYIKRSYVDHTMYSTASILRTMELILGLPPMSQYDARATPLYAAFASEPTLTPFIALSNSYPLDELNTRENELSRRSKTFDFRKEDAAPDIAFNEVIWKSVKGIDSEMPAPRRAAFLKESDDD